jgi:hypothetical protein
MNQINLTKYSALLLVVFLLCACSGLEAARAPAGGFQGKVLGGISTQSQDSSGEEPAPGDGGGTIPQQPGPSPTPNPSPVNDPAMDYPVACTKPLQDNGFVPYMGKWVRKVRTTCGVSSVGYVEGRVTVDPAIACNLPPEKLAESLAYLTATHSGADGSFPPNTGSSYQVLERHCSTHYRCDSPIWGTSKAIGRLAWIVKCENQVPAFKEWLQSVREFEDCSGKGTPGKNICFFNNDAKWANYFPEVKFTDQSVPEDPSVEYGGNLYKLSDLMAPSYQSQLSNYPCPSSSSVAPIDTTCYTGCYRADQRILLDRAGKYQDILSAKNNLAPKIAVLTQSSTVQNLKLTNAPVGRFLESKNNEHEILIHIETELGIKLVVTLNHPLLDATGVMREASKLKVHDQLLRIDGRADAIKSIKREAFYGKVYNVAPLSPDPSDNLLVAEGVITGSHNYQTELYQFINRVVLRSQLSKGY